MAEVEKKLALGSFSDFSLAAKQYAYQNAAEALYKLAASVAVTDDKVFYEMLSDVYEHASLAANDLAEKCDEQDIPLIEPLDDEDDDYCELDDDDASDDAVA